MRERRKGHGMRELLVGTLVVTLATTVAHAAPTPPSRAGFGPAPAGALVSGRHESRSHEDPYGDCGDSDIADLDFRATSLVPEIAADENAMTVFRLTNRGPCPARNVAFGANGLDVFSRFRLTCPDLASEEAADGGGCFFPAIAPGETKTFFLSATVCAFVTGEGREQATYGLVRADSTDPDAPDGFTTYEFAYAYVHIVGPYDNEGCTP